MTGRFAGKHVLVTGAASGIGRETAFVFAEAGATLELVNIQADDLEREPQGAPGTWPTPGSWIDIH